MGNFPFILPGDLERQRREYEELKELYRKRDWDKLCSGILFHNYFHHEHDALFIKNCFNLFYHKLPDRKKYDFLVEAYTFQGNKVPEIRKAVTKLRRYGKPKLPARIASKKVVTIYRCGTEDILHAKYRISWSLSKEKAFWFMKKHVYDCYCLSPFGIPLLPNGMKYTYDNKSRALHLYQGKISTKKIIAYASWFNEHEVMQYKNVFNIRDISPNVIVV